MKLARAVFQLRLMMLQPLRLTYGFALIAIIFTPFGVYHSISEPYIIGSLWGYHLLVGYVGLVSGILVVLYPKIGFVRNLSFGSLMILIGLFLMLSFIPPKDYFVNLLHGTTFHPGQIDVDYPAGNSVVLALSILSIAIGFASRIKPVYPTRS